MKYICGICGIPEEEHHDFARLGIPDGCVCDWREWDVEEGDNLPAVCEKYVGDGGVCGNCEHDKICHKQ